MGAGFAVGLVAGILFEEPGLVIDQIAGRATEVPLAAETQPAGSQTPDVAAAPVSEAVLAPSPPEEVPAAEQAIPEPASKPAPAAPAPAASRASAGSPAPRPRSGYSVQVGAYGDEAGARRLAERVGEAGFPAYVSTTLGRGARYRVRVGPVASRDEARQLATRLERELELKTWVLSETGP
jgi:DedD protein